MSSYLTFYVCIKDIWLNLIKFYMYAVFKVQSWLIFYQSFKKKIPFLLKSLVKPVLYLSGLPVFLFLIWRPPALPHRLQCSTIGRLGLNRRVRDGNGCVPQAHRHQKFRDTKVSAQSREKGCWKLASIKTFYQGCICDAVATKELLFRGSLTHLNT